MGPGLHWFPEDTQVTRLAAVLVGMANAAGGTVLLGIAPRSGQILGVKDIPEAIDRVFQAALLVEPPLVLPLPQVREVGEASLVVVTVPPGLPYVFSLEGRYLGREGAQTNPLPARRLRQLLLERGVVLFESRCPPGASLEDLDVEQVEAYREALRQRLGPGGEDLPVGSEPRWELLLQRGCLKRLDGQLFPTYAALLLFGRYPQQWLPNATLLAARFSGAAFSDQYLKQDLGGTLPEQLRRAEIFIHENLRRVVRLVGLTHQETTDYPFEAVRELLVNAIAHRDYNLQGDNIHLNMFQDRIEVQSPGGLPGPVTLENLLEARFSRNPVIVQVLSDLGFVERLGYGLDRVVTVMRQNGMRLPRFEETGGVFRVTLFGELPSTAPLPDLSEFRDQGLNPRQERALAYLAKHRRITQREYAEICPEVHAETLRRDLADLVARGKMIKVGDKRATYYIRK
jgi:ATP-dependent DNA helicase RecG